MTLIIVAIMVSTASVGFLAYESATGCILVCGHDQIPGEAISVESAYINSSIFVTLTIRNVGTLQTSLSSYSVNDSMNHQFVSNGWSGPTLSPNVATSIGLSIDGKAFTFQSGSIYNILLVSSTNKHWLYTLSA